MIKDKNIESNSDSLNRLWLQDFGLDDVDRVTETIPLSSYQEVLSAVQFSHLFTGEHPSYSSLFNVIYRVDQL